MSKDTSTDETQIEDARSQQMRGGDGRADLRRQIDDNLRRAYAQELEREVPDRFRALLDELSRKEAGQ